VLKDDDTERNVGVPGMNSICRHLAGELDVRYATRIDSVRRHDGRWQLLSEDGAALFEADALVVSAPAPQTAALLESEAPAIAARVAAVDMAPCWAVMAAFDGSLELPFDGGFVADSPLSWVARNASKPDRPGHEAWVLHASPRWSRAHLELDSQEVIAQLLAAFATATGREFPAPLHVQAHRWRYALPSEPLPEACLFERDSKLVACGDWCAGPRVEGAFLSGVAAAGRLLSLPTSGGQLGLFAP
jgi:predicted NAD/FAD-dependent oxidoreductase